MLESLKLIRAIWSDRHGVTAVEYGLIAAAVSAALITALALFGPALTGAFAKITSALG